LLLTAAAQKELARVNHISSCEKVIELAGHLLKSSPRLAARVRSYASTVKVTLHGDTATVPKLGGGGLRTLTYSHVSGISRASEAERLTGRPTSP
jgi:hypothetical protein